MPVTIQSLIPLIQALNTTDCPYIVKLEGNQIIGTWNILDAKWLGLLSVNKANKDYKITVTLDESCFQYTYVEVSTSSEIHAAMTVTGPTFGASWRGFRGKEFVNKQVGMNFSLGMQDKDKPIQIAGVATYNFDNAKIKNPILDILKTAGWLEKKGFWGKLFG